MSASFNGQLFPNTQSIAIPGPITATKNRSVLTGMCWVKLNRLPVSDDFDFLVYSDGTDSPSRMRYKIKTFLGDAGAISVGGTCPDGTTALFFTEPSPSLVPDKWIHIAGAVDYAQSFAYIYVDGDLVASGKVNGTYGASQTSNTNSPRGSIGSLSGGDSEGADGLIEDVRLYSVHSPSQIKTIASLHGKDSVRANLLHRFPLKDLPSGNISVAANIAASERIDGVGARNPTWSTESVLSFEKRALKRAR